MTGLTKQDYVDYISMQLGGSILEIECKDDIPKIVDMAFKELKNYITEIRTVTVPYAKVIDLSNIKDEYEREVKIMNIYYITRGKYNNGINGLSDIMYIYRNNNMTSFNFTDYARSLLVQQLKNTLSTDMDFQYDKFNDKVYLYCHQALPSSVTLFYAPDFQDVSEILEPFWQSLLKRLSLAYTKEVLGRIRSKYKLNSSTYSLDGDTLLSEANSELQTIREYLNKNSDMVLPID